jgi:hypothetical protein
MAFSLRAIRATRPIVGVKRDRVLREMLKAGVGFTSELSKYPPARTSYRRTGDLGRDWTTIWPRLEGADLVTGTGNNVVYAGPVQGFRRRRPRQRKLFRGYGWPSAEDIGKDVWKKRKGAIIAALQGR